MEAWRNLVPDSFALDLKLLEGWASQELDQGTGDMMLRHFPRSALSNDIRARFMQLFQFKPKWTLEELDPYLW